MRKGIAAPVSGCKNHKTTDRSNERISNRLVKRGAIVILYDPVGVFWNRQLIPLSPTEAYLFERIAVRGRASFDELDKFIAEFGSSPQTRNAVMVAIRRKLAQIGAANPFERLGKLGFRFVVEPDENGSTSTVIGLNEPQIE